MRKDVREAGAKLLFLPTAPISPNEQVFTKLKTLRRKAAERAGATTWKRIGSVLNEFKYRFTSFRISL